MRDLHYAYLLIEPAIRMPVCRFRCFQRGIKLPWWLNIISFRRDYSVAGASTFTPFLCLISKLILIIYVWFFPVLNEGNTVSLMRRGKVCPTKPRIWSRTCWSAIDLPATPPMRSSPIPGSAWARRATVPPWKVQSVPWCPVAILQLTTSQSSPPMQLPMNANWPLMTTTPRLWPRFVYYPLNN